jgi:hypothetical protein
MKIPIPALVVPIVWLLLYLFVPGLRQRPWTALRVAGAIVAIAGYFLFVTARIQLGRSFVISSPTGETLEFLTLSRSSAYPRIRRNAIANAFPGRPLGIKVTSSIFA